MYFTVQDEQQRMFTQLPKALLYEDFYKKMSNDAKVLYSFLMDKVLVSLKNNWVDEKNQIFIRCSEIAMAEILNKSEKTVRKFKNELIDKGLLEQADEKDKTKLYVKKPIVTVERLKDYLDVFNEVVNHKRSEEVERNRQYRLRRAEGKVAKLKESLCTGKNYRSIENTSVEGVEEIIEENAPVKTTGCDRSKLPVSNNDFSKTGFGMYVCTDESEQQTETPFIKLAKEHGITFNEEMKSMIMSYENVFEYELYEYLFLDILNKYRNGKVSKFENYLLTTLDGQSSRKQFTLMEYLDYKRDFSNTNYPRKEYKVPKKVSKYKDNNQRNNEGASQSSNHQSEPTDAMSVPSFDVEKSNNKFDEKLERIRFRAEHGLLGVAEVKEMSLEELKEYVNKNNIKPNKRLV